MAARCIGENTYSMSGAAKAVVWAPALVMVCVLVPVRGSIDWTRPGLPIATCTRPVVGLKKVTSGSTEPAAGQTAPPPARECHEVGAA